MYCEIENFNFKFILSENNYSYMSFNNSIGDDNETINLSDTNTKEVMLKFKEDFLLKKECIIHFKYDDGRELTINLVNDKVFFYQMHSLYQNGIYITYDKCKYAIIYLLMYIYNL